MNKNHLASYHSLIKWKDTLEGDLVELEGDEGEWWYVESDNGDRIEVVAHDFKGGKFPPREIVSKKFILRIK